MVRNRRTAGTAGLLRLIVLLGCVPLLAAPASAEPGYPSRPVRIMVGYGPGGVADVTMRMIDIAKWAEVIEKAGIEKH
jgi:tripartite-type tricarboxylate transporter receptor subunit TctC